MLDKEPSMPYVDPMLGKRHRRWTNIGSTQGKCVPAGKGYPFYMQQASFQRGDPL